GALPIWVTPVLTAQKWRGKYQSPGSQIGPVSSQPNANAALTASTSRTRVRPKASSRRCVCARASRWDSANRMRLFEAPPRSELHLHGRALGLAGGRLEHGLRVEIEQARDEQRRELLRGVVEFIGLVVVGLARK